VDGGYADNYGMASLVEWLENGLSDLEFKQRLDHKQHLPQKILIVEIRSSPAVDLSPAKTERGFLFQTFHPAQTLWNVRATGQLSHNELERDLVRHRWAAKNVSICSAVFQPAADSRVEPLNWHLTLSDISWLKDAWNKQANEKKENVEMISHHLKGEPYLCN
jgi:hypothetical protein